MPSEGFDLSVGSSTNSLADLANLPKVFQRKRTASLFSNSANDIPEAADQEVEILDLEANPLPPERDASEL